MRLTDACALLPSLATRIAEPETDARVLHKLAGWCQHYTPIVSVDGADGLWLDITGAAHLCGGEAGLLADLKQRLTALGFENRLGLAGTPGAAWAIARFAKTRRIVSADRPDSLLRALHPLPLDALRLDENALYLLRRFGLKTIGALCALPRASLKRRFPSKDVREAVLRRLDQALGHAAEPITPLKAAPAYFERLAFPEPILDTESFCLGLRDLMEQLARRMEKDSKGATRLVFSAYHADGGLSQIAITTARPSRDPKHLSNLFRDKLETINPGFGVDVLVLSADGVEDLVERQLSLSKISKNIWDNGELGQLIDRLSNRLGPQNIQRVVACESHIPERAQKRVSALQAPIRKALHPSNKPLRPIRLFDPPEQIQVIAEIPEGPPAHFTWRRVIHRVARAEGPERIAPEWWHRTHTGHERTRDYYRVEDVEGRCFWLFREGLYGDADPQKLPTWHIHGLFA